jgi:hypothetical protein
VIRLALAVVAVAVAAGDAVADRAASDRLAAEADAAAAANDYKTAATKFAAAYQEDPTRTDVFCNVGISYYKAGELPRAHLLLEQCVARSARDLAFKDTAKAVVAAIEQILRAEKHTPVTIRVTPENATVTIVEFGPESSFVGARTVWLPFGTHRIEVRLEGYKDLTTTVETSDQNPKSVELTVEKAASTPPPRPPKRPEGPQQPSKLLPIATSVVTAAAIVVAVVAIGKASAAADRSVFAIEPEALADDKSEVSMWNTVTGVSGAVAVIGAAASTYLWVRATRPVRTEIDIKAGATGAAVMFRRRF